MRLTVVISSARLVSGKSAVAALTLENTGETTSVPKPRFGLTITDTSGTVVFENQPPRLRHPITLDAFTKLTTGAKLTTELTFSVPAPGRFLLYANAAGMVTPPLALEVAAGSD